MNKARNIYFYQQTIIEYMALPNNPLTESMLSSCCFSPFLAAGSLCNDSRHAEPRDELLWWDCTKWDTVGLGLLCLAMPACLASSVPAVLPCAAGRGALLMCGSVVPQRGGLSSSPTRNEASVCRLGCEEESVRTSAFWCCFFLLKIQIPPSFLPSPRLEASLLLLKGLDFAWNCFHIFFW